MFPYYYNNNKSKLSRIEYKAWCLMLQKCDKKFHTAQTLREHLVSHMAVKPYQCHICGAYLSRLSRLRLHLRAHSARASKSFMKVFKCSECHQVCLFAYIKLFNVGVKSLYRMLLNPPAHISRSNGLHLNVFVCSLSLWIWCPPVILYLLVHAKWSALFGGVGHETIVVGPIST